MNPPRAPLHSRLLAGGALLFSLLLPATARAVQYDIIETRDLRLVYHRPTLGYLAPYTTQCFENSLNFYRRVAGYEPTEKVNVFLEDFGDFMNAGVWGTPRSSMSMHVAPANFVYETSAGNERINFTMNHEVAHLITLDMATGMDPVYRSIFQGKVRETNDDPETILYGYLTLPRRCAPRWHREGTAVFFETWMSGGLGRAQGSFDEMVFRAMVNDSARFYDPLGLESEGTKSDFQVGVNAYLYGTRFMTYMAYQYSPEQVVEWIARKPGSKAYFASQFKHVFGKSLNDAWSEWIEWEHRFQRANLDSVARYATTPYRDLSPHALGSLSRAYLDSTNRTIYSGLYYPGTVAYIGEIPIAGGPIRNLHDVKGPALYFVTSLAYDPDRRMLFYTTDNYDWRGLVMLDPATRKSRTLMRNARIGDLVFNRQDRSLWGVRHFNGISTLVRLETPYQDYVRVASFPYSHDLYDIDLSPDGTRLVGSMTEINGHQTLRMFDVATLLTGDTASRVLYDFGTSIPQSFVFSPDGRALYGSSYYTGVSNIFRYDLAADSMEIVTNGATGFFRPMPLRGDSLVAFRFTAKGFVPCLIHAHPLQDVSAITFLGQLVAEKHPVVKSWVVPSPASVNLDSTIVFKGAYRPIPRLGLASMYPIVEGYKVYGAYGVRANVSDPYTFYGLDVAALYSPMPALAEDERWHATVNFRHGRWDAKFRYNGTSFYDLFGPTRVSRKGLEGGIGYERLLINDTPRTLELTALLGGYANIEQLPFYQNVSTPVGFNRGVTPYVDLHYKFFRTSLGWVDPEKGVDWHLKGLVNSILLDEPGGAVWRGFPQTAGTLDLGSPLPVAHSSLWIRTAAGYSPGDRMQPFANFYFGGFGNNYVDYQDVKRYRTLESFPGIPINDLGGTNFVKGMVDLNLPPLRFRHLGVLDFYATWARLSLFSTGIVTNADAAADRRKLVNVGAQADIRLSLMIQQPLTLSFGWASACEELQRARHELMISLRILG